MAELLVLKGSFIYIDISTNEYFMVLGKYYMHLNLLGSKRSIMCLSLFTHRDAYFQGVHRIEHILFHFSSAKISQDSCD
jgi:hypothetical protein